MSLQSSPPSKRVKIEDEIDQTPVEKTEDQATDDESVEEDAELGDGDHCSICLQLFVDRAVIPECAHDFCFECMIKWTGMP